MSVINVEVRNRIARGDRKQIVLSNSDYTVHFDLDAEWANYHTKTMVVAHDNSVQEVVFTGTDAQLPIFEETPDGCADRFMAIGLYAGDIRSSTPAVFPVLSSAKGMAGMHIDPPEDVYLQILEKIEQATHKPYLSVRRLGSYLYEITFDSIPESNTLDDPHSSFGCSAYVQDGKLYRDLDWNYAETATFHVICKDFEGMAFIDELNDGGLIDSLMAKLPYRLVDGKNDYGIRISTHVLFNDWNWQGSGNVPLYQVPYLLLSRLKTLDNLETQISDILSGVYATPFVVAQGELTQFLLTDGIRSYAIVPPMAESGPYQVIDISANPKMANFRWVPNPVVVRTELQERPTGVERWNLMPCELSELRFTKAYETPERLSEFIGLRHTTKDSSDAELEAIYDTAHALYLDRTRDGSLWQTVHSVVYGHDKLEHLWVQENWNKDYCD